MLGWFRIFNFLYNPHPLLSTASQLRSEKISCYSGIGFAIPLTTEWWDEWVLSAIFRASADNGIAGKQVDFCYIVLISSWLWLDSRIESILCRHLRRVESSPRPRYRGVAGGWHSNVHCKGLSSRQRVFRFILFTYFLFFFCFKSTVAALAENGRAVFEMIHVLCSPLHSTDRAAWSAVRRKPGKAWCIFFFALKSSQNVDVGFL